MGGQVVRCTRVIAWDAAHRIPLHESKCATLHGHRYTAEIECEADALDSLDRVVDFGVVQSFVGTWVDQHWDHTTLVAASDAALLGYCTAACREELRLKAPYVFDGNPTAERIAVELFGVATRLLADHRLRVVRIRVYETPNCWADVFA